MKKLLSFKLLAFRSAANPSWQNPHIAIFEPSRAVKNGADFWREVTTNFIPSVDDANGTLANELHQARVVESLAPLQQKLSLGCLVVATKGRTHTCEEAAGSRIQFDTKKVGVGIGSEIMTLLSHNKKDNSLEVFITPADYRVTRHVNRVDLEGSLHLPCAVNPFNTLRDLANGGFSQYSHVRVFINPNFPKDVTNNIGSWFLQIAILGFAYKTLVLDEARAAKRALGDKMTLDKSGTVFEKRLQAVPTSPTSTPTGPVHPKNPFNDQFARSFRTVGHGDYGG